MELKNLPANSEELRVQFKAWREQNNLSYRTVADLTDESFENVFNFEAGKHEIKYSLGIQLIKIMLYGIIIPKSGGGNKKNSVKFANNLPVKDSDIFVAASQITGPVAFPSDALPIGKAL